MQWLWNAMLWNDDDLGLLETGTPPDSIVENVHLNYPLFVIHPIRKIDNTYVGEL